MFDSADAIRSILNDLVHQFSDPLSFYRELVQNSIDAGSGEVDIRLEYDAEEGRAVITVADYGEGMTREIIEDKLTRLFSSGKDDDLTKIGRFGIGFVSVFAIEPDHVVVDTGREGTYLRALFFEDRTYELYALEEPLEGTTVTLLKTMSQKEFLRLRRRTAETVRAWCKHAEVPVYVDGEEVRQPFDIGSPCKTTYEEQGTRIVMGMVPEGQGHAGYFNRGLTLKETVQSPWPWVAFKIDSRYLEHTLTRDQLIEDQNFEKASELLDEFACDVLPEQLFEQLEEAAAAEEPGAAYEELCHLAATYLRRVPSPIRSASRREIFATVCGERLNRRGMRRGSDRPLGITAENGSLAAALVERGDYRLLFGGRGARELLEALGGPRLPVIEEEYLFLGAIRRAQDPELLELSKATRELLSEIGVSLRELLFAEPALLSGSGEPSVVVATGSEPVCSAHLWSAGIGDLQALNGHTVVINRRLPEDVDLAALAELAAGEPKEPEIAALSLLEVLLPEPTLHEGLLSAAARGRIGRTGRLRAS